MGGIDGPSLEQTVLTSRQGGSAGNQDRWLAFRVGQGQGAGHWSTLPWPWDRCQQPVCVLEEATPARTDVELQTRYLHSGLGSGELLGTEVHL